MPSVWSHWSSSPSWRRQSNRGRRLAGEVSYVVAFQHDMLIRFTDFNNADAAIRAYETQWRELENVLAEMPLHLKASDQEGIQGNPIFDPVGTNEYIKAVLTRIGWRAGIAIPQEFNFLGKDVDFVKDGAIVEVQFSNYPFLLNNTMRSELFFKAKTKFGGVATGVLFIVTKAKMFPASNSTLYYEQAISQLTALTRNKVFDIPMRLIGLFERVGVNVNVKCTAYGNARYSRMVSSRLDYVCDIEERGARCTLTIRPATR